MSGEAFEQVNYVEAGLKQTTQTADKAELDTCINVTHSVSQTADKAQVDTYINVTHSVSQTADKAQLVICMNVTHSVSHKYLTRHNLTPT